MSARRVFEIVINNDGFSKKELTVPFGKSAFFLFDEKLARDESNGDIQLVQVISDDTEGKYRPVVGGYRSQKGATRFPVKFKLAGHYYFKLVNHPNDPPVLKMTVADEIPLTFLITDNGFMPRIIRIEEHTTVKWQWSNLKFPHSIYEAEYCDTHNGIFRTTKELATKSLNNSYKRVFKEPGLYYFQTDAKDAAPKNLCMVEVHQSFRDRPIEILDNKFNPARITIEEGDRVLFHWNKSKCSKKHKIYQIESPLPDHAMDKPYTPAESGFKWGSPTFNGLIVQKFDKCGVYYFSDVSDEESASYIGVIVVKQKCETHILEYNPEAKNFGSDLITMETGDYIFWKWNNPAEIVINLSDYNFLGNKRIAPDRCKVSGGCESYNSALTKTGTRSFSIRNAGIYYFDVFNGESSFVITVVATSVQKDHKITIADNQAQPKILEVYPEDRVWFVWDNTRKPKNIRQVDHQNQVVPGGFLSGSLMDSPGTYLQKFDDKGLYYYRTDNLNQILGAIVVVAEPSIQLINVLDTGINPDPMVVHVNDIVIWAFTQYQTNDVVLVDNEKNLLKYIELAKDILPRRYLSHAFSKPGMYHFASPSFDTSVESTMAATKGLDNTILSTVIVDRINDHSTVVVDETGFHPNLVNVELGKSVLFDWQESRDQLHNIIHVTVPDASNKGVKIITGPTGFNSGKVCANKTFLHRFDKPGKFSVVSEGAPEHFGFIQVHVEAAQTATPELVRDEPVVVYRLHKVYLKSQTPNATIYYTTDGSTPSRLSTMYDEENAAILVEEGIAVLRAIAYSDSLLTSDIFTSQRFYVIPEEESKDQEYNEILAHQDASETNKDWWLAIPKITYSMIGSSCVEITFDVPPETSMELISHYQLFMNKVSYKKAIIPNTNRIVVKGLAGGKNYETVLMVYPKSPALMPQQSNLLMIKCPMTTPLGGPIISLKATSKRNQVLLCWQSIDSKRMPIDQYQLMINGEKREIIKPKPGQHKVTIESVKANIDYSIILVAIPKKTGKLLNPEDDEVNALISNEFELTLPLDVEKITLPDVSQRKLDKDYYDEYMEIIEYVNPIPEPITRTSFPAPGKAGVGPRKSTAGYPSYENYLIPNKEALQQRINFNPTKESLLAKLKMARMKISAYQAFLNARKGGFSRFGNFIRSLNDRSHSSILSTESKTNEDDESLEPDRNLPVPKVGVSHLRPGVIHIQWHLISMPPREYKLTHYVIILMGCEFGQAIMSDASYECVMNLNGVETSGIQHSWIMKPENQSYENKFTVEGILDTAIYQICVNAVYRYMDSSEYKKASKIIDYTALGPPIPPRLRASTSDVQCVSLDWVMEQYPRPEFIKGYRLIIDSQPNQVFEKNINEFLFKEMQPGRQYEIEVITLTNWIVGSSPPSNRLTLVCPHRPHAPLISQLPNIKPYTVMIGWKPVRTKSTQAHDTIASYKVFVNKVFHGEIFSNNSSSYSYVIEDLVPGKNYSVMVQAFSGEKITYPTDGPHVSCLVASEFSNDISVCTAAPPGPTRPRLAAIHTGGIDISWNFPEQYGDATCSGFQLVRNGKCVGSILPPECNTHNINNLELGDLLNLQIISLTNHPVGKYSALQCHPDYTMDQPQREFVLNGTEGTDQKSTASMSNILQSYPGCMPGAALSVKFTGLVKPVSKLWTERITGYSAMAIYETSKMGAHFVDPDYFLISFWPGDEPDENVTTIRTQNDYVKLDGLKPSTIYTIIVESRRESTRSETITDTEDSSDYKYIIFSQSSRIQFQTASPPDPPTNLFVESSTCHAVKIRWDPPVDHGAELLATRIDCYPLNVEMPLHLYKELTPDTNSCIIENLSEKTSYRITITAITEEYLIYHKIKDLSQIPKLLLSSVPWLPSAHIDVMTSGTEPAANLNWSRKHDNSIGLSWRLPKTYGTNHIVNQVVCYQKKEEGSMATQIPIPSDSIGYKLTDLVVGAKYRIWIEAVVCVKLHIDATTNKYCTELNDNNAALSNRINYYKELKDNRCINVSSEQLVMRVPAPCEPTSISLTGYTNETIDIQWPKPYLYSQHNNPDNPDQRIHIYRHLIGYKLLVNNIQLRSLQAHETVCTLIKCKPLNTYNIVLSALTCIPDENNDKLYPLANKEIDPDEIDESNSLPLQVKTFSGDREDQLTYILARYEDTVDHEVPSSTGRVRVEWVLKDESSVAQFNVIWFSVAESTNQRKSVDASTRVAYVPVTTARAIYEIKVDIVYKDPAARVFSSEILFIETPGPPETPTLWLKELKDNNAVIHWSEPREYPFAPVTGYQIYLNDVKVHKVSKHHLKHTLALKMNKSYKINVQALSTKSANSELSTSLHVITSAQAINLSPDNNINNDLTNINADAEGYSVNVRDTHVLMLKKHYERENENDFDGETTLPIKLNKLTEEYFDLDWSAYVKHSNYDEFKVYWHCLDTNEHFEQRLGPSSFKYRVKNLNSGNTYCVRVAAIQNNTVVVNKSKHYIIQTSAPPDAPNLKLRARNFNYISLEWNKPNSYGDAKIVAYKIYIDGKSEAVLSSDQTTYTMDKGEACHEYSFQVQAICNNSKYSSLISAPVLAIWPGIMAPAFRELDNDNGRVRVGWDEPIIAGNTKVSYYRVLAECEHTGEQTVHGPFENHIRDCSINNMNVGKHKLTLEIYACGIDEPFVAKPVYLDFSYNPEAPTLVASIPGLERRMKIDRVTSSLCNKRDRLLKIVTNCEKSRHRANNKSLIPKAMCSLRQLDDALNDCLKLIANFTGYFIVNLSWTCEQPNPMIKIAGYRVYINDKQYGVDLNSTVKNIRIKLSLEKAVYSVYVSSFTNTPRTESKLSNKIELLSENFFPFSFFCLTHTHSRMSSWPEKGCCAFEDSLAGERINLSKTREPLNIGLLSEPVPAPKVQVLEMSNNKTRTLIEAKSKSGKSTIILFWTKWCLASIRALNYIVMYAQRNNTQNDYIACHHGANPFDTDNSEEVFELIKQAGYLNYNIRFVSDFSSNPKHANIEATTLDMFDVKGVPSIVILNRSGFIIWKGRFCAYDYHSFENFMHHTLSECIDAKCPIQNCETCANDISIDTELNDLRSMLKGADQYSESLITPNFDTWAVTNAPLPQKISTRLISASLKPYNVANMNARVRPNSVNPNSNSVYFNKDINRKVYNFT